MRRCSTPPEVLTLRTRAPSSPMSIFMQNITRQRRGIVGWCADFCAVALSDCSSRAEMSAARFAYNVNELNGWGTWIRTKTGGVRVRCPTVRRSPTICSDFQWDSVYSVCTKFTASPRSRAVLAASARTWQGASDRRSPALSGRARLRADRTGAIRPDATASSVGQKNMFNVRVLRPHPCAKQSII